MISGKTTLIAHLGYPTEAFKAPMIYNPYFEEAGIDAVVVPMGVKAEDYPAFLPPLFRLTNIRGALVTMPHKVTTVGLLDEVTTDGARSPAPATRSCAARTARCWATCSTAPASCAASSARAGRSRARARWWSAAAASARPSRPRWPPPGSPASALFDVNAAAAEALGARLQTALSEARGHDRLQGPRRLRHRGQRDAARA